jgi:hypothetical protein
MRMSSFITREKSAVFVWRIEAHSAQNRVQAGPKASELHAVERMLAGGQGKPVQFIPIRFLFNNKLNKDDKLLLALDAFALSKSLGRFCTTQASADRRLTCALIFITDFTVSPAAGA